MSKADFHKAIIGRAELLHFMEFSIPDVPAKVDTGAYRSAVHSDQIKLQDSPEGPTLSFRLLGGHPVCGRLAKTVNTVHFQTVKVTNSFGHSELRYAVKLKVRLGPKVFWSTFSLADRSTKIYPILLGRKLLNGRFLVDTANTSVKRLELKQRYGIVFPEDAEETS